jgi:hypothetical protein
MGIGGSLFLIAVGLILALAFGDGTYLVGDFEVTTAGWILAIVGALGLVVSLIFWSNAGRREERTVIRDREREVV